MTPADSPENKCPTGACLKCGGAGRFGDYDCLVCGGSGRINTSGGEAGSREARNESRSSTTSGLIHTSPSVDPQCPDCGGMGSDEGGFRGGKKWKAICPRCGGSGRINTSGPDDSKIENKYQGSPSVPDRETGTDELVIEEHVPCEGDCEFCKETARAADDYQYEFDSTAESVAWLNGSLDASSGAFRWVPNSVEATTPSAPSAAPTNPGENQTEGEGEDRFRWFFEDQWWVLDPDTPGLIKEAEAGIVTVESADPACTPRRWEEDQHIWTWPHAVLKLDPTQKPSRSDSEGEGKSN